MSISGCFIGNRSLQTTMWTLTNLGTGEIENLNRRTGQVELRFHGSALFPEKAWLEIPRGRRFNTGEFLLGSIVKGLLWIEGSPDVRVDFTVHAAGYEGPVAVLDLVAS